MGGNIRKIPTYKDNYNSPFDINNEAKKIEREEKQEKKDIIDNTLYNRQQKMQQMMQPNPLVELKINEKLYQQPQIPPREPYYPYMTVPNPYIPTGLDQMNANGILNTMYGNQGLLQPYQIPVIKKYNVSLGGVSGDHTKIAEIFEDILPSGVNLSLHSFTTLKERSNISDYVRSVFIKTGDGEEVVLNGGTTKPEINKGTTSLTNLLSRVKFLEINPYHFSRLTNNPYKTIPKNFVMYRSCYPIKLDKERQVIQCSKTNVGMNIRIYGLTNTDILRYTGDINDQLKCDVFREIQYYNIIKKNILQKELSPNFVQMYTYYRAKNMNINFKQFELLRNSILIEDKDNIELKRNEYKNRLNELLNIDENNVYELSKLYVKYDIIKQYEISNKNKTELTDILNNKKNELMNKLNIDKVEDDNIVILTEAPTQNIYNWATKTYEMDPNGSINKMVQTGFYSEEVWESILFQLYVAMLLMYKNNIIFNNFSLENNVFIKHVQNDTTNIGYWKYTINNIDYNIKNYGYLVVIDSSNVDLENTSNLFKSNDKLYHKIISKEFKDDEIEIKKYILNKIKEVFNSNNFGIEFTKFGGISPNDKIKKIFDTIQNYIENINNEKVKQIDIELKKTPKDDNKIREILNEIENKLDILPLEILEKNKKFNFISNRIGTLLTEKEVGSLIQASSATSLSKTNILNIGDIVAEKINDKLYKYCMIIKNNPKINILTTDKPIYSQNDDIKYEQKESSKEELYYQGQLIEENYMVGFNYSRLESYKIN